MVTSPGGTTGVPRSGSHRAEFVTIERPASQSDALLAVEDRTGRTELDENHNNGKQWKSKDRQDQCHKRRVDLLQELVRLRQAEAVAEDQPTRMEFIEFDLAGYFFK